MPSLKTHIVSTTLPAGLPKDLDRRSMQVRRVPVIPLESIVRGYITGSAWTEYKKSGTVHGMPMPDGLKESQKLEQPIWTPSTKAEQGEHDENISRAKAVDIVGEEAAAKVEKASLEVYKLVCIDLHARNTPCAKKASPGPRLRREARYHYRRHEV